MKNKDGEYMRRAIILARKGSANVHPNPMVGAVIVKNDKIIGEGYHERYGGLHAERNALQACQESPEGATLYVTLEPCCHYGKTPPCTAAIIQHKIARVVIGTLDPNPKISGKSVEILKEHHIQVTTGVLEESCKRLIRIFRKYITTQRPFVLLKYAMTMDGKIATRSGQSRWITGELARWQVQKTRQELSAIMVGVQTVLTDDPLLTCRLEEGRTPLRIICDTHLRTPLSSKIVKTAGNIPTMLATGCEDEAKKAVYRKKGCEILMVKKKEDRLDLENLMVLLGQRQIDSVLLEGGGTLSWSALQQRVVDEVEAYVAPKIFGGPGKSPVEGEGVDFPDEAITLRPLSFSQVGKDYRIESEVLYPCLPES